MYSLCIVGWRSLAKIVSDAFHINGVPHYSHGMPIIWPIQYFFKRIFSGFVFYSRKIVLLRSFLLRNFSLRIWAWEFWEFLLKHFLLGSRVANLFRWNNDYLGKHFFKCWSQSPERMLNHQCECFRWDIDAKPQGPPGKQLHIRNKCVRIKYG